jgi:pilus assembly protein Flp/PilA
MLKLLKSIGRDTRGVSALEYAILAAIILVAVVAGLGTFGDQIGSLFQNASDALGDAVSESTSP